MIFHCTLNHPLIGTLVLLADDERLIRSSYLDSKLAPHIEPAWKRDAKQPILKEAVSQLGEYLSGERQKLTVPLRIGGTEFQQRVYEHVLNIPIGTVTNYLELARKLKKPLAARSVGAAIGQNPLLIFIPDHRVTTSSGSTGGFAGKWNRKPGLLKLEKQMTSGLNSDLNSTNHDPS